MQKSASFDQTTRQSPKSWPSTTSEAKYNLSDPETPDDERKNVFGGNSSPTNTQPVH